jgi:hypothetical protein
MKRYQYFSVFVTILILTSLSACNNFGKKQKNSEGNPGTRWSIEKVQVWSDQQGWLRGSNFNPSTAINQLETWQAESFNAETIDRELGWAEEIGFNCMRVFLHHLAWQTDKEGFKTRMEKYLSVADSHGIKTIFVFFDDCWNAEYKAGKQPDPKPGVHNSGWVRDPGDLLFQNPTLMDTLEVYVKDILTHFRDDQRIALWDLYNEPGNNGLGMKSMPLLKNVFAWAREVNPSQPVSVGVWNKDLVKLNEYQLENSDVITYHNYSDEVNHKATIDSLKAYGRPMVCTEYMARTRNSRFENILPLLKQEKVGAINWGLVSGKSNTMYAWDTPIPDGSEPKVWFHDIFRPDGSVFDQKEVDFIMSLTLPVKK